MSNKLGEKIMCNVDLNIYNKCLTNLSNSILKYYQVDMFHNSLQYLDKQLIEKNSNHVILILLDGLGTNILNYHLNKNDFLIKNKKNDIFSVIPTTTTAATTTLMSGLNPVEHGWIGWDVYFEDIGKIVTLFTNNLKDSNKKAEKYNVAKKKLAYKSIFDLIKMKNKDVYVEKMFPFGENKYENFEDAMKKVRDICKKYNKSFTYVYCEEPDAIIHKYGTKSKETHCIIKKLNATIQKLSDSLTDATVMVVADHGHIDSTPIFLTDYPEILNTLRLDISIESRACAFFVKENKKEEFKKIFNEKFAKDFILYTKDEVINKQIFGEGKENKYLKGAIGDFVALAISNKYFRSNKNCKKFVSQHAGITKEELLIPLIII